METLQIHQLLLELLKKSGTKLEECPVLNAVVKIGETDRRRGKARACLSSELTGKFLDCFVDADVSDKGRTAALLYVALAYPKTAGEWLSEAINLAGKKGYRILGTGPRNVHLAACVGAFFEYFTAASSVGFGLLEIDNLLNHQQNFLGNAMKWPFIGYDSLHDDKLEERISRALNSDRGQLLMKDIGPTIASVRDHWVDSGTTSQHWPRITTLLLDKLCYHYFAGLGLQSRLKLVIDGLRR